MVGQAGANLKYLHQTQRVFLQKIRTTIVPTS